MMPNKSAANSTGAPFPGYIIDLLGTNFQLLLFSLELHYLLQEKIMTLLRGHVKTFCPVTTHLLLQPHLTSCCGKHISKDAVTEIQKKGGKCPLCNALPLSTILNKHFQREVKGFVVFCDYKCGWQGELSALDHHLMSCPMKDTPLQTQPSL